MDWMILIVMVPTMVLLVVLLCGFTGCAALVPLDPYTAAGLSAPYNLKATVQGEKEIKLEWEHDDIAAVEFRISESGPLPSTVFEGLRALIFSRTDAAPGGGVIHNPDPLPPLIPGRRYCYQVEARRKGDTSPNAYSVPSNISCATLPEWQTAYDAPLNVGPVEEDRDVNEFIPATLVQRIDWRLLNFSGTVSKVQVTLRGARAVLGDSLVIAYASISHPALLGKPWDSEEKQPTMLGSQINLPGATSQVDPEAPSQTLPPVNFPLRRDALGVLIAFEISTANSTAKALGLRKRTIGVAPSAGYLGKNKQQVFVDKRDSSGYVTKPNTVYFVEKIRVLTTPS